VSATQPISGTKLAINQRLQLVRDGTERLSAFDALLARYVRTRNNQSDLFGSQAGAAQAYREDFSAIADARRDLRLALAFSTVDTGRRVYIPADSR
jgi:hypothetical protein